MSEHGAPSRYNTGCRCLTCTKAHRLRLAKSRAARFARTEANGGVAPTDPHGTSATYSNWGCRCDPCTEANRQNSARARERAKAAAS